MANTPDTLSALQILCDLCGGWFGTTELNESLGYHVECLASQQRYEQDD